MSNRPVNRAWHLAARPQGLIRPTDFAWREAPVPALGPGEALVRTIYLSLDPTNRVWASDADQYMPPVGLGEVMRGVALGEVVESRQTGLKPGDLVYGLLGWQDFTVLDKPGLVTRFKRPPGLSLKATLRLLRLTVKAADLGLISKRKLAGAALRLPDLPLTSYLGILGAIGFTAYVGIIDICQAKAGETLVVTGAAGAVGSIAAQIGKLRGCRVVGIAGSDAKCQWLTTELGLDAAINYRTENVEAALRRHCPRGIDCVFENVGGALLDASLALVNNNARIALCGLIAQYNAEGPVPGPYRFGQLLMHRVTVKGFIILDHAERFPVAFCDLAAWLAEGQIKYRVHVIDGLENAPVAVNRLFDGSHDGKLIVRVAPERA
jgi:NADPH-dependent curcumin reductase CurA